MEEMTKFLEPISEALIHQQGWGGSQSSLLGFKNPPILDLENPQILELDILPILQLASSLEIEILPILTLEISSLANFSSKTFDISLLPT